MESRWRRNVGEFGMLNYGSRKIARLVGQPFLAVTDLVTFAPEICQLAQYTLPAGVWDYWFAVRKPDVFANFPYGFNVEPDELP